MLSSFWPSLSETVSGADLGGSIKIQSRTLKAEVEVVGMTKLRSEAMKHEVAPRPSVDSRCATRPPNLSQFTDRSYFKTEVLDFVKFITAKNMYLSASPISFLI